MTIACGNFKFPDKLKGTFDDDTVRDFMVAVLYVLTFAPDRDKQDTFEDIEDKFEKYFGNMPDLEGKLEESFFTNLYIERKERKEILQMMPAKRLILVPGFVGVGKTIITKKIEWDFLKDVMDKPKMVYYDLKAEIERFVGIKEKNFNKEFRRYIYDKISGVINNLSEELLSQWKIHRIIYDRNYARFRNRVVQDIMTCPLGTDAEKWREALDRDDVNKLYLSLEVEPNLTTVLSFLKKCYFSFSLCFDNVDRHPFKHQISMLATSIDLTNEVQIPIILAIREPNLSLLVKGAGGDIVMIGISNRHEEITYKGRNIGRIVRIERASDDSVRKLFKQRFNFLKCWVEQRKSDMLTNLLTVSFSELRKDSNYTFEQYVKEFWEVYDVISTTFLDQKIYEYCNYNLRQILGLYFKFITGIMFKSEKRYSIENLIALGKFPRKTELRNYFYKWLVCNGGLLPTIEDSFLNVLRPCSYSHLQMLELKVLEFIYNWSKRNPRLNLTYKLMRTRLERFGIQGNTLRKVIDRLSKNRGVSNMGFIWVDCVDIEKLNNRDTIQITPSGSYFLDNLSTSRDYIFWVSLAVDLKINLIKEGCNYSKTYNDEFRMDVVYNLIEKCLIPDYQKELMYVRDKIKLPNDWTSSKVKYYKYVFAINDQSYICRLLDSILRSIKFVNIEAENTEEIKKKKDEYTDKYLALYNKVIELEKQFF